MLSKILTPAQDELLKDERRLLSRLRTTLTRFDAAPEHQQALDRSIEQLDELFLLVIVGEFNAGKSAFINALLGSKVVTEGVTPTTAQINVLQYGDAIERHVRESNLHVITAPAPLLREIHIVDTPGTNAIIREHEAITVRVRAALRPGPVRDLGRSAVHGDRAGLPGAGARLGQEGRRRHQQDRHLREPARRRRRPHASSPRTPARCSASAPRSFR